MGLATAIKRVWHDDLVAHADTHAWVLGLYRAGELHPQTVDDYFPTWATDDPALRAKLEAHRDDEALHVRVYDRALARIEREAESFGGHDVFNWVIRDSTEGAISVPRGEADPDRRAEGLAGFLAHAHFLERRVVRSVELHQEACSRAGKPHIARLIDRVHQDEVRHQAYTREAVFDLLPRARALAVLETHQRGEARANLAFSARQVRAFLARFRGHARLSHRALFRASAAMMELGHAAL